MNANFLNSLICQLFRGHVAAERFGEFTSAHPNLSQIWRDLHKKAGVVLTIEGPHSSERFAPFERVGVSPVAELGVWAPDQDVTAMHN